jgi:hypothetical protein
MHQWRILLKWGFDTHKKLIINKLKSQKVKRERERLYIFRSSDDGRDGFGCFRKDRIGVNSIQADVGGDVKTRHLRLLVCVGGGITSTC